MIFGFIFHLYQWALRGVHLPSAAASKRTPPPLLFPHRIV